MNSDLYLISKETERLVIEKITPHDCKPWTEFFKSEEASLYLPNTENKAPAERAQAMVEKQFIRYKENKHGLMKLLDKRTKHFIGMCGLLNQHFDNTDELEIGYHLFPAFWKQGYATEAARFFRDFGFENNLANSLVSIIHINNIASQKVALKNGMKNEKQTRFFDMDVFVFRITEDKWKLLRENENN